jgi:hypothetical protein
LIACLASAKSSVEFRWRSEKAFMALTLAGVVTTLPGALVSYASLHFAAMESSHSTLTALQYDPAWNHIRFNYKLLQIDVASRFGKAGQPVMWPPPQRWWFERPPDAPPERSVDLRRWAVPQAVLLESRVPNSVSGTAYRWLRAGCLLALCVSLALFAWQLRLATGAALERTRAPASVTP